jgi:hypothetical protein
MTPKWTINENISYATEPVLGELENMSYATEHNSFASLCLVNLYPYCRFCILCIINVDKNVCPNEIIWDGNQCAVSLRTTATVPLLVMTGVQLITARNLRYQTSDSVIRPQIPLPPSSFWNVFSALLSFTKGRGKINCGSYAVPLPEWRIEMCCILRSLFWQFNWHSEETVVVIVSRWTLVQVTDYPEGNFVVLLSLSRQVPV